jgi:auxin efflux carrier family protein
MSSALVVAIIGALQGSLSVLLTILYGVIATRCGMITPPTIKDVSTLCANVFLPALQRK